MARYQEDKHQRKVAQQTNPFRILVLFDSTGIHQLLDHTWNAVRDNCLAAGFQPTPHIQRIYHPADGALIDIGEDEIYVLPDGSRNTSVYRDDPAFACLPISDMEHAAFATINPKSKRAKMFIDALEKQVDKLAAASHNEARKQKADTFVF